MIVLLHLVLTLHGAVVHSRGRHRTPIVPPSRHSVVVRGGGGGSEAAVHAAAAAARGTATAGTGRGEGRTRKTETTAEEREGYSWCVT